MEKLISKQTFLILGIIVIFGFGFIYIKNYTAGNKVLADVTLPSSPTPIPQTSTGANISPDGRETLTMKIDSSAQDTNYSFYDTLGRINFSKTVPSTNNMSIPFNTWSPNDKYAFVKEVGPTQTNYWVLPAGINLTDYFAQKLPNYQLGDVTGWASDVYLIVNTNNPNGSVGPSFWFDITSKNFIILATRFN